MFTEFNRIYALEIDLKNLETIFNSKALYANTDLNTSAMLIKLSLGKTPLDVTDKIVTAYIKTAKDQIVTMQRCEILEANEGVIGLDFKSSALKTGTNTFFLEIKSDNEEIINSPLITYKVVELFDVTGGSDGENNVAILSQIITEIDILKTSVEGLESEIAILRKSIEDLQNINMVGKEVQLQKSEEYIQWKYADEEEWRNLIALEELKVKGVYVGSKDTAPSTADIIIDNSDGGLLFEEVVPNIQIGEVTTLEPGTKATVSRRGTKENPIFDFGIPKGENGGSNGATFIDDTTISTEKTWSSTKIEDFVHTNDDVVWSTVQGENLSIEYAKEGYLREVEIWGNTIQGFADCVTNKWIVDSILSTGLDDSAKINDDGTFTITYAGFSSTTDWSTINKEGFIQLEPNTKYSVGCWRNNGTFPNVYYILYEEMGIKATNGYAIPTFTTGASGKVLLYPTSAQSGKLNLRVVKGDYKLTDYSYDFNLGHIQHLGELYVDEEGQPILDKQGREQYKIEVESANYSRLYSNAELVDIYNNMGYSNVKAELVDGKFKVINNGMWGNPPKVFKGESNTEYTFSFEFSGNVYPNGLTLVKKHSNTIYTYRTDASGKFGFLISIPVNSTIDFRIFKGNIPNLDALEMKSYKTTLLLPCQLMKVGDVADKLYWDGEKKKYVVEKNVYKYNFAGLNIVSKPQNDSETFHFGVDGIVTEAIYDDGSLGYHPIGICNQGLCQSPYHIYWGNGSPSCYGQNVFGATSNRTDKTVSFAGRIRRNDGVNDIDTAKKWIEDNDVYCFYQLATPQLIETNITEQILLPCYKDKTHLFVTGGIDGGIKIKAPLDGGQAIQSLSTRNVALSLENEELKETNDTQDILINTTMLATDEMYTMLEPLLSEVAQTLSLEKSVRNPMVDMYVAMVMRELKTIEQVPARYGEEVREILAQLEK